MSFGSALQSNVARAAGQPAAGGASNSNPAASGYRAAYSSKSARVGPCRDRDRLHVRATERAAELRRLVPVELQEIERHRGERRAHVVRLGIDEQPDDRHERRQRRHDRARASRPSTTRGVPGQNTRPIASAPARAAATPSSTRVMPQILTRVRMLMARRSCERQHDRPARRRQAPLRVVVGAGEVEPVRRERRRGARAVARGEELARSTPAAACPRPTYTSAPTMLRIM